MKFLTLPEQNTNHLEIQPLQLAQVLQEVYDLTHLPGITAIFSSGITDPEIYILADPRWLRQVVNLVDTFCISNEGGQYLCFNPAYTGS